MLERVPRLAVLGLALLIPAAACDTADPAFGSVSVYLTDAPGDVTAAWVTITDIYLQGSGGEGDPPGGRVYLLEDAEETHDLLSLQNALTELVGNVVVPTGTYGQARVVVSHGCIEVDGERVYSSSPDYTECGEPTGVLHMPSLTNTGIKVLMHGFQVTGGDQALLLDFNVAQTFGHEAGQSNRWVMNPVIHGAEIHLTAAIVVTLSAGEVELPEGVELGDFGVTLVDDTGEERSAAFEPVEGEDFYRAVFEFLIPSNGPFVATLDAPEGWTADVAPASPQELSPGSGATVQLDWVLQEIVGDEEA